MKIAILFHFDAKIKNISNKNKKNLYCFSCFTKKSQIKYVNFDNYVKMSTFTADFRIFKILTETKEK